MNQQYDVVIIGAGPAGLSAGLYAARSKMSVLTKVDKL
jgi:thioredoxin reductase (NADPH)